MADMVQERLDSMVPDLRDLLEKGMFTESEIPVIVERRRQSEYLLRRKNVRKSDFLRYAEAEIALERLRSIRHAKAMEGRLVGVQKEKFDKFIQRQKLIIQQSIKQEENSTKTKKKNKSSTSKIYIGKSPGDTSIIRNIHLIFVRTKRKWKSDVSLHLAHAEFAKRSKSYEQLGTIYAEALQILPKTTALWIEAASHEFFGYVPEDDSTESYSGGSVHSARVLLQRGLRVIPNAEDLWIQYFALEWHLIQKMRGRKEILKLDAFKTGRPTQLLSEDPVPEIDSDFFQGSIPAVIYKNAIKTIPNSFSFRFKFLEVCKLFPETKQVEETILTTIAGDFGENPNAWIAKATFVLSPPNIHNKAIDDHLDGKIDDGHIGFLLARDESACDSEVDKESSSLGPESPSKKRKFNTNPVSGAVERAFAVLEEATSTIVTSDMFVQSFDFLHGLLNSDDYGIKQTRTTIVSCIEMLMRKADSSNVESLEFVSFKAWFLSEIGRNEDAMQLLLKKLTHSAAYAKESKLWLLLADLTFRRHSLTSDERESSLKQQCDDATDASLVLKKGILSIPMHDPNYIFIQIALFEYLLVVAAPDSVSVDKELIDLFQSILVLCSQRKLTALNSGEVGCTDIADLVGELCLKYMQVALMSGGVSAARNAYETVLFRWLPNLHFASCSKKLMHFFLCSVNIEKTATGSCYVGQRENHAKATKRLLRMYDAILAYLKQTGVNGEVSKHINRFQQLKRVDCGHFGAN